ISHRSQNTDCRSRRCSVIRATNFTVCGAALFWLCACGVRQPAVQPAVPADPAHLWETVRAREERIVSLRARFIAENERNGEQHRVNGVLLVKKPAKFRLRMMLPFGLTVFDYVSWGGRAQLSLPLEDRIVNGPPWDEAVAFSQEDLGQAFLRGANAFP